MVINSNYKYGSVLIDDEVIVMTLVFLLYVIARLAFYEEENARILLYTLVLIGVIIESIAVVLFFFNSNLLSFQYVTFTSYFGNPNVFTAYLISILPFAYMLLLENIRTSNKYQVILKTIVGFFIFIVVIISLLAVSRIAIFAFFLISILMIYPHFKHHMTDKIKVIITVTMLFIGGYLCLFVKLNSSYGRVLIWKVSSSIVKDHFITGVGIGRFEAFYNNYQAEYFIHERSVLDKKLADESFYPFNEFLGLQVENGLIGLLLFIVVFLLLIKISLANRHKNSYSIIKPLLVSILGVLLMGFVGYPLKEVTIKANFFIYIGAIVSANRAGAERSGMWPYIINVLLAILLSIFSCFSFYRFLKINQWKDLHNLYGYRKSIDKYKYLYPQFMKNGVFLSSYGNQLYNYGDYKSSLIKFKEASKCMSSLYIYNCIADSYVGLGDLENAEKFYIFSSKMVPGKFRPKYNLFNFYIKSNQIAKGIAVGHEILNAPVKVSSIEVDMIKEYVQETLFLVKKAHYFR